MANEDFTSFQERTISSSIPLFDGVPIELAAYCCFCNIANGGEMLPKLWDIQEAGEKGSAGNSGGMCISLRGLSVVKMGSGIVLGVLRG